MSGESRQETDTHDEPTTEPRRRLLVAAAALAPVLAAVGTAAALAEPPTVRKGGEGHGPVEPVRTAEADWNDVAKVLGRSGNMVRGMFYHTAFPRGDLHVVCYGVKVTPELALGSHVSFARYTDGSVLVMGDLNITEGEVQQVTDELFHHGIEVTALHKHLPAHTPDVWWTHIHAHGHDPLHLARGLRAALDRTKSPPAKRFAPSPRVDLNTAEIETLLKVKGASDDGIYKSVFVRREPIIDRGLVLPPGLGSTTAFNFQPLGHSRAAVNGDFVMVADEVQDVLKALRRGGISLVELHNHSLTEEPRLFFTHFWGVDDAVTLAKALYPAVKATNVVPVNPDGKD